MNWFTAFLALFATDICWACYVNETKGGSPWKAGVWAVLLFVTGAFVVIGYTTNQWLLIPECFGAFCGTAFGTWWNNHDMTLRRALAWVASRNS